MESILSCKRASRGWHYYGKNMWKRPKKDEIVFAEKESSRTALEHDPYSRAVFFFISRSGKVVGRVLDEKCYPSPIPKGGLEILLIVQFKIADEKRKYMGHLKEIITKNYTSDFPEGTQIENHEDYIKTVKKEEQAKYDSDSDHVIDDETDDIICID